MSFSWGRRGGGGGGAIEFSPKVEEGIRGAIKKGSVKNVIFSLSVYGYVRKVSFV